MILDLNRDREYNVQKDPIYPCGRWDFFISLLGGTFAVALTYIRGICCGSSWHMPQMSVAYVAEVRGICRRYSWQMSCIAVPIDRVGACRLQFLLFYHLFSALWVSVCIFFANFAKDRLQYHDTYCYRTTIKILSYKNESICIPWTRVPVCRYG